MFPCAGSTLVGVLHLSEPRSVESPATKGLVIVVGGPQYRVGSHRQFVLLARHLAEAGVPVLRFDYRGMGDSEGDGRDFSDIGDDIRAAVDALFVRVPGLSEVVLWGLCDAATAIAAYASGDARVTGLVLLNPWVRTEAGAARAQLRHYYAQRALSRDFWTKLARGALDLRASLRSLHIAFQQVLAGGSGGPDSAHPPVAGATAVPDRMLGELEHFAGRLLFVLSGRDLTADEFRDMVDASPRWRRLLSDARVTRLDLPESDHTFSTRAWRHRVAEGTAEWVRSW